MCGLQDETRTDRAREVDGGLFVRVDLPVSFLLLLLVPPIPTLTPVSPSFRFPLPTSTPTPTWTWTSTSFTVVLVGGIAIPRSTMTIRGVVPVPPTVV